MFAWPVSGQPASPKTILILGDSLTEGYGVDKEKAFPAVLEQLLNKNPKKKVKVVNAGISGSTSASAISRLKWSLRAKPDVLIIALGANDGLRGISPEATEENLRKAIELVQSHQVKVILGGMQMPPNYGPEYRQRFASVFSKLAKIEKVDLIPFLLQGVAGVKEKNIEDGIHPNEAGHREIAKNIVKYVERFL